MYRIQKKYLLLALLLFAVEVVIAVFVHDQFVRPFGGDFLVVILIYCSLKAFWDAPVLKVAGVTLLFAYLVETLQYFQVVKILGLQQFRLASIVIGTTFEWSDILAYTLGISVVIGLEKLSG